MQDSQAQVQNVPIDRFNDYIRQLGRALSFPEDQIEVLIQSFQYFNRQDRYRLITDTQRYVDNLNMALLLRRARNATNTLGADELTANIARLMLTQRPVAAAAAAPPAQQGGRRRNTKKNT